MNIAIDIDDTLTESFEYFQRYFAEYLGVDLEELREKARLFESVSGEQLPEIDEKKIIVFGEGELPNINIDMEIPCIELEISYDEDFLS